MLTDIDPLLSIADVRSRLGVSRSFVYDKVARQEFPTPVKVGARAIRFRQSDVAAWAASLRPVGLSDHG